MQRKMTVISRTLSICIVLGLVSNNGTLTGDGKEAIRKTQFENVV